MRINHKYEYFKSFYTFLHIFKGGGKTRSWWKSYVLQEIDVWNVIFGHWGYALSLSILLLEKLHPKLP